jgi:hypothetical protein
MRLRCRSRNRFAFSAPSTSLMKLIFLSLRSPSALDFRAPAE